MSQAQPSAQLTETILRSVEAIRLSGVDPTAIDPEQFEVPHKGHELRIIAGAYIDELTKQGLIDYAEVLRCATRRLAQSPEGIGLDTIVMIPFDARWRGLERELVVAIPAAQVVTLAVDTPASEETPAQAATDIERLRWLRSAAGAPAAIGDDTVAIVRAVGEANEVRNVLRSRHADKVRLDDVELLHTDVDTYVPLVHEIAASTYEERPNRTTCRNPNTAFSKIPIS